MTEPTRYETMFNNVAAHFNNLMFSLTEDRRMVEASEHSHKEELAKYDETMKGVSADDPQPPKPAPAIDFAAFYSAHDKAIAALKSAGEALNTALDEMKAAI